jgi:hypothetical protein
MSEDELTEHLEQIERWQCIIEQSHWECVCLLEDAKCHIGSEYSYYVNVQRLRVQLQQRLARIAETLVSI